MDFERLLEPVTPELFRSEYSDRKPLYIPAPEGADKALLSWDGFEQATSIMANWPKSTIRLAKNKQQLDCSHVRTTAAERGVAGTSRTGTIDMAKVHELLAQGYNFVGARCEYILPELGALCADLNARLNVRATAILFASFRNIGSFDKHFDTNDVFAIQCEGRKRWQIFAARADSPVKQDRAAGRAEDASDEVIFDEVLGPGDVIYVPRGYIHEAVTQSDTSLHVSISLHEFRALKVVDILRDLVLDDPAFRANLPDVRNGDYRVIRPMLTDLADRLAGLLASDRLVEEIAFRQNIRSQPWHRIDMAEVASSPRYIVLLNAVQDRDAREERLAGYLSTNELPLVERRVVEWIADRKTFSRAALAAEFSFAEPSIDAMLARLEEAGLIAEGRRG